jgi:transcriptional regulator with XRE-family HTH domain
VTANTVERQRLRLRTPQFDAAAAELWGTNTPKRQIAKHLGVHPTVLSVYRTGRRMPTADFIVRVLDAFSALPDAGDIDAYFEVVDTEAVA